MAMTAYETEVITKAPWERIKTGDDAVAVAERPALGTSARIAVWPPENLGLARAAIDRTLADLDRQASRFRPDSEISRINKAGGLFLLSDDLAQAIGVALAAARWTGGLVDPTVGDALMCLGYDRDFAAIDPARPGPPAASVRAPGWRTVELAGVLLRHPAGVRLDLGATAKGLGSDRAVRASMRACEQVGGVLVSLGGDLAVAGTPPRGGWPVTVADQTAAPGAQLVRLPAGAIATSSVTCRSWRRAGQVLHHIVDPRTGRPASGPWLMASVAAATCADANAAATAALVAGAEAEGWLGRADLPARLVGRDGRAHYIGGWPEGDGEPVPVPAGTHVYGGPVLLSETARRRRSVR
jgi:thiamine biosynthesis lipoprotein